MSRRGLLATEMGIMPVIETRGKNDPETRIIENRPNDDRGVENACDGGTTEAGDRDTVISGNRDKKIDGD